MWLPIVFIIVFIAAAIGTGALMYLSFEAFKDEKLLKGALLALGSIGLGFFLAVFGEQFVMLVLLVLALA